LGVAADGTFTEASTALIHTVYVALPAGRWAT
jgi:hypothetical protein